MAREIKVPLSEPVTAYGETIDEIVLRRPKGRDIRDCGYPFKVYEDGGVEPIAIGIARYISTLGKIPMGAVDQLEPVDFNAAMTAILDFFGESPGTVSGSSGSSPDSSDASPPTS